MSDADLEAALKDAHVPPRTTDAIVDENEKSRIDGLRVAVSLLALFALLALPFTRGIPTVQPGSQTSPVRLTADIAEAASRGRAAPGRPPHSFQRVSDRSCFPVAPVHREREQDDHAQREHRK